MPIDVFSNQQLVAGASDLSHLPGVVYVFTISAAGVPSFSFVSQACSDLYGFSPEAVVAEAGLMHDAIHPDDRGRFDDAGQHSLRTLQPVHWEGRIVRPDGAEQHVLIMSTPRRQPDGGTEWVGMITPRVRSSSAGEDRPMSRSHLDGLATLGHDLGAPLSVILASAELALEALDGGSSEHLALVIERRLLQQRMRAIVRHASHLTDLRADLLALAAADADAISPSPTTVEVLPGLLAAAEVEGDGIRVLVDCPPDLVCFADPTHLSRILSNLVSNAVRYATHEVHITAVAVGDQVHIAVEDDGPGVLPETSARLFRRFAHAGASNLPAKSGTGLGLYIVRMLAQANHGVAFFLPADSGARFVVALPSVLALTR